MSEFFFAASHSPVPATVAKKRNAIAREVGGKGCGYVAAKLPDGYRSWGFGPNRGDPFDRDLAQRVRDAWTAGGVGV
jgi:hypothetical protein